MVYPEVDGIVQIPRDEWRLAQERLIWLDCLTMAGVDNWSGIGHAQELYEEDEEIQS